MTIQSFNKYHVCYLGLFLAALSSSGDAQIPPGTIHHTQITPTTTLGTLPHPTGVWSVDQVADGFISDVEPLLPGFVADADEGVITLTFGECFDLDGFLLWNDVRIEGQGIDEFSLEFFSHTTLIATRGPFNAMPGIPPGTVGEVFAFSPVFGVSSVDLVVASSHANQIELREVTFSGVGAATCAIIFEDGFESGNTSEWFVP